jgi:hypothetical protein
MAFLFASASSQYLSVASTPVTVEPLTISLWYRVASTPTNRMAFSLGRSTGQGAFRINVTGTTMLAQRVDDTGGPNASSSTTVANTVGTWYHAAAVFLGSGQNVTGYINGTAGTPATNTGTTLSTLDRLVIGTRLSAGSPGLYFDGDIAEVGVWNAALNADEIAGLAKGFACRFARPSALVWYSRLIRNAMDIRGGRIITNNGTATPSPHPRIIYPC